MIFTGRSLRPWPVRAVVVLSLLVGLIGMHQLPVASDQPDVRHGAVAAVATTPVGAIEPAAHAGPHEPAGHPGPGAAPAPAGSHGDHGDLLHLCLAVLTAVGLLAVAAVLLGLLRHVLAAPRRPAGVRIRPRGPPPPVPRRLAQLCVLRR
ncbi:DUF6153 family protein [Pseudonocardia sp. H11422]|uniref:DUF6153 family protein n=1 Tax=Pseudonocardia sp. H11422 TaxID=2835866 RepID=UPI00202897A3|nr:DUF6153 family protein [Pseudonocardia sp. H11422]